MYILVHVHVLGQPPNIGCNPYHDEFVQRRRLLQEALKYNAVHCPWGISLYLSTSLDYTMQRRKTVTAVHKRRGIGGFIAREQCGRRMA
jgi:hypothetical protein